MPDSTLDDGPHPGAAGRRPQSASIRLRTAADLPGCVDALWPVHQADGYPIRWPPDPTAWLEPVALSKAWVAQVRDRIVGHVGVVYLDGPGLLPGWDIPGSAVVTRLFVTPDARGLGAAAGLLAALRNDARADERITMLEVIEGTAAVEWYESRGWTRVDRRPADWKAWDGADLRVGIYLEPGTAGT